MYLTAARPNTVKKKKNQESNISMIFCFLYFINLINTAGGKFLWLKFRNGTQGLVQFLILPDSPSESEQVSDLLVLYL